MKKKCSFCSKISIELIEAHNNIFICERCSKICCEIFIVERWAKANNLDMTNLFGTKNLIYPGTL